jgi:preprotein translocase subunit SecG
MCTAGFIPMSIACYLGYIRPVSTGFGEKVSNYLTKVVGFLLFIFYPLAMIANIMVSKETLNNEDYK